MIHLKIGESARPGCERRGLVLAVEITALFRSRRFPGPEEVTETSRREIPNSRDSLTGESKLGMMQEEAMAKFLLGFLGGILTLPIAILIVARLGLLPIRANVSPSGWESTLANMALSASAARQAPQVPNPIVPTEENLMARRKPFFDELWRQHGAME